MNIILSKKIEASRICKMMNNNLKTAKQLGDYSPNVH